MSLSSQKWFGMLDLGVKKATDPGSGSATLTGMLVQVPRLILKRSKWVSSLRTVPRAMGKLLKEAERVKLILSANTECYAQVRKKHFCGFVLVNTSSASESELRSQIPGPINLAGSVFYSDLFVTFL